jgi:hypothetical protein
MNVTTDTRLNILKTHLGVRTYLNPLSWRFGLPYRPYKWWINPFFGPIEITLFASRRLAGWFSFQSSIGFECGGKVTELRFHPFTWRVSCEFVNKTGYTMTSRWIGPFWIYTYTPNIIDRGGNI